MAERRRLTVAAILGAAVGLVVSPFVDGGLSILVAWDVTAATLVLWIWLVIGPMDAERTRAFATREDASRALTRALLLAASTASLLGVLYALVRASEADGWTKAAFTVTGVATVVISWTVVHTMFALRYAHLYYDEPAGGIDFKDDGLPPAYLDLAYVAFTVGMTFQVSDTDISSTLIRRAVLRHALLSYLFGTVIVASAINIIAGLLK